MNWSRWRSNRFLVGTATSAAAIALIAVGVPAAAMAAHSTPHARAGSGGPGYPPPGGIYKPFTNCPILNPLMKEGVPGSAVICSDGHVNSGSITIGNITTPVIEPVDVQFGGVQTPNADFGGDWTTGNQRVRRRDPAAARRPVRDADHQAGPDPGDPDPDTGLPQHQQGRPEHLRAGAERHREGQQGLRARPERGPAHELRADHVDPADQVQAHEPAARQQLLHREQQPADRDQPERHRCPRHFARDTARPQPEEAPQHRRTRDHRRR